MSTGGFDPWLSDTAAPFTCGIREALDAAGIHVEEGAPSERDAPEPP